jgi:hypothetical protein
LIKVCRKLHKVCRKLGGVPCGRERGRVRAAGDSLG